MSLDINAAGILLTVVIPSYNAAAHLETCISSFFTTKTVHNFEIIIVNDGSTDNTAQIAQTYVDKYPEHVRLLTKTNNGHGSAINEGVKIAKGRYFKVVDSDDWVINFDKFLDSLHTINVDAVITGYQQLDLSSTNNINFSSECKLNNKDISLEDLLHVYSKVGNCCSFHGLTYKTENYKKHNITLSERVYYNDQEYACLPFYYVNTVHILPYFVYQYTIGRSSQSVSFDNQVKNIDHMETVLKKCISFRFENTMSSYSSTYFLYCLKKFATSYLAVCLIKDSNNKKGRERASSFYGNLQAQYPELYNSVSKKYSLLVFLNYLHFPVAMYSWLLNTPFRTPFKRLWTKILHKRVHTTT